MFVSRFRVHAVLIGTLAAVIAGCGSSERALIRFSYAVEPEPGKSLPPGMKTIFVQPASLGPTTDQKWSDLSSTILQNLVNESRTRFGTQVNISDRRDTQVTFGEADLKAAGMSTEKGGAPGQLLGAQGAIVSNINVKTETAIGKERTISGIDLSGLVGEHGGGGGHVGVQTDEVETTKRTLTVQIDFRLLDTATNRVWDQYSTTQTGTESTKVSPFFGKSGTEANLTPQDQIIGTLVERAAREFLSRLMPVRVDVETEVESSSNANCREGVRLLRSEQWGEAVAAFESALAADGNDHRAAYGAGVACEASGKFADALRYYQRAIGLRDSRKYAEARDRMKAYSGRVRMTKTGT